MPSVVRVATPTALAGLDASLRRACLRGFAVWQVVMCAAIIADHTLLPWWLMAGLHLALAALILRTADGRIPLAVTLTPSYALYTLDFFAATPDSVMLLAACWMGDTLYAITPLLMRARYGHVLPTVAAAIGGVLLVAFKDDWLVESSTATVVTALAMTVAVRYGVRPLLSLVDDADAAAAKAATERHSAEVARVAGEDARVLHDTVINTLGAIATGGLTVADRRPCVVAAGTTPGPCANSSPGVRWSWPRTPRRAPRPRWGH